MEIDGKAIDWASVRHSRAGRHSFDLIHLGWLGKFLSFVGFCCRCMGGYEISASWRSKAQTDTVLVLCYASFFSRSVPQNRTRRSGKNWIYRRKTRHLSFLQFFRCIRAQQLIILSLAGAPRIARLLFLQTRIRLCWHVACWHVGGKGLWFLWSVSSFTQRRLLVSV